MTHSLDNLKAATALFKERNKQYGDSYLKGGAIMQALFPEGVTLETEEEFSRYNTIHMCVTKLNRYCQNFYEGGHEDSARDLIVYAAILQEKTDEEG